jgi:4-hydroxy-tetrahydrodipicolinate synthase
MNQPMKICPPAAIAGVCPVLPTPFDDAGQPDLTSLRTLVRYLLKSGVDGITYPGVASEVSQLSEAERVRLTTVVLDEVAGRVPVIVGASSNELALTLRLARGAVSQGAAALMVAAPANLQGTTAQVAHFSAIAQALPGTPIMLQNVPPPAGAGLEPESLLEILAAVPAVRYIKEETLPSGQRLTAVALHAPTSLLGVFGGAGGRYITDELRRGACGTMPAIELAEVHVALFAAHRRGDEAAARRIFTRMLPVLNIQAVFRWSLTKYVLQRRGMITSTQQRAPGPLLDPLDRQDVDAFLADLADLLLPGADLALLHDQPKASCGTA